MIVKKIPIIIFACWMLPLTLNATVLISNHFDSIPSGTNISSHTQMSGDTQGTMSYNTEMINMGITLTVLSSAGHSGSGLRQFCPTGSAYGEGSLIREPADTTEPNNPNRIVYPNKLYIGFWIRMGQLTSTHKFMRFYTGNGEAGNDAKLMFFNSSPYDLGFSCYISEDVAPLAANTWYYVIAECTPASTGSGRGSVKVYVNNYTTPSLTDNAVRWDTTSADATNDRFSPDHFEFPDNTLLTGTTGYFDYDDFIMSTSMCEVTDFLGLTTGCTPSSPTISENTPLSINTNCVQGSNASSQSFDVWNSGGGTLSYTVSGNASWLSCTPSNGTSTGGHGTITVNFATSALAAGSYSATITITAAGASNTPQNIPVILTVSAGNTPPPNPNPNPNPNPESTTYALNISVTGGHGTIAATPSTGPYTQGTVVSLTATPDSGYQMKAWIGTDNDTSKNNTNTVTMNAAHTVSIEFELISDAEENKSGGGGGGCFISTSVSDNPNPLIAFIALLGIGLISFTRIRRMFTGK